MSVFFRWINKAAVLCSCLNCTFSVGDNYCLNISDIYCAFVSDAHIPTGEYVLKCRQVSVSRIGTGSSYGT
jgi:hypothetical protein